MFFFARVRFVRVVFFVNMLNSRIFDVHAQKLIWLQQHTHGLVVIIYHCIAKTTTNNNKTASISRSDIVI